VLGLDAENILIKKYQFDEDLLDDDEWFKDLMRRRPVKSWIKRDNSIRYHKTLYHDLSFLCFFFIFISSIILIIAIGMLFVNYILPNI